MTTRRALGMLLFASLALGVLGSCGEPPPPEGFEIRMRLVSIDPSVIESVRVTFLPQGMQRFMFVEPMSYEDGNIDLEVAPDGVLVMTIRGAHVAANAAPQGDGTSIFPLEVWSSDTRSRMGMESPGMRVVVNRGGEAIADSFLFLPQWPPPLGGNLLIQVPCSPDAVSRGRCRP